MSTLSDIETLAGIYARRDMTKATRYEVVDTHTQLRVSLYRTRAAARRAADRLDLAYGAVRFAARATTSYATR